LQKKIKDPLGHPPPPLQLIFFFFVFPFFLTAGPPPPARLPFNPGPRRTVAGIFFATRKSTTVRGRKTHVMRGLPGETSECYSFFLVHDSSSLSREEAILLFPPLLSGRSAPPPPPPPFFSFGTTRTTFFPMGATARLSVPFLGRPRPSVRFLACSVGTGPPHFFRAPGKQMWFSLFHAWLSLYPTFNSGCRPFACRTAPFFPLKHLCPLTCPSFYVLARQPPCLLGPSRVFSPPGVTSRERQCSSAWVSLI